MNEIIFVNDEQIAKQSEMAIVNTIKTLNALKEREKELRAELIEEMKKRGIKSIETDNIRITYKLPYDNESLDSTRLRKENPDIYDEYCKISSVKESVEIKVK